MIEYSKTFNPQLALNSIYNGILAIDENGNITYFNKTAEKFLKIPFQEALHRYILDVLPNTGDKMLECLNTGKPFYGEKLKDQKVTIVFNINPIMDNGKIIGVISVFQDISEIEMISKELDLSKNMKNWLNTIIDSSFDGLWICDHEGKVIRINKASERINSVKAEDVIGKDMSELVVNGLIDKSVSVEVLKRKASFTMIQKIKGGKTILVTGNPILNEKGEIAYVVNNERDMTELDKLRSQLQEVQALAKGYSSKLTEWEMKGIDLSKIIFRSTEMERITEVALRVAKADATILLLGESGVGKGVLAKLIHKHSDRNTGPFIRVDCADIPDSLIESELFGYEKGAFTGAKPEGKPGLFDLANKGTLFLDEIGEIPLNFQPKLLRFLEDHEIVRIGGTEPRKIDVRIISATNKDIEKMVLSKSFREDLYYRLNIVPIYIPPLRKRRDDILPLIYHFVEKFNTTYQKKKVFSAEVIEALYGYNFPGNIRELSNFIERIIVLSENDRIEIRDLPKELACYEDETAPHISSIKDGTSLKEALEKYESMIIERIIRRYGSQRKAAKVLKIDQATISRKAKKYFSKNDA